MVGGTCVLNKAEVYCLYIIYAERIQIRQNHKDTQTELTSLQPSPNYNSLEQGCMKNK